VRIKRADLPRRIPKPCSAACRRAPAARRHVPRPGLAQSQKIKADADATVTGDGAQAQQQSEQIRGEGDAERNRSSPAYGSDPDSSLLRSMQAYERPSRATRGRS